MSLPALLQLPGDGDGRRSGTSESGRLAEVLMRSVGDINVAGASLENTALWICISFCMIFCVIAGILLIR